MSDIKEVKVTLTEKDAKEFTRSTTRKRKMKGGDNTTEIEDFRLNKLNGDEPKPLPTSANVVGSVTAATTAPNATAAPAAPNATAPTSNKSSAVTIVSEKKTAAVSLNPPSAGGAMPKIIPKKKHLSKAPTAGTVKKPALVIQSPKTTVPETKEGSTRRRRFTERKISVPIRSTATTRKQTHTVKEQIAKMPIASVRKMLLRKGLIKANARTPDEMSRALLLEYMLLHRAE
jgi:hypothetical protein